MNPTEHPTLIKLADYFLGQKDTFQSINQWQTKSLSPPEIKSCIEKTGESAAHCVCHGNLHCEMAFRKGQEFHHQQPRQASIQMCQQMFQNQHEIRDKNVFMQGCVSGLWN